MLKGKLDAAATFARDGSQVASRVNVIGRSFFDVVR